MEERWRIRRDERARARIEGRAHQLRIERNRLKLLQARENELERRKRTRRLILVGATILKLAERSDQFNRDLHRLMDQDLRRKCDRDLFDLPERMSQKEPPF
jgi:hypothetical protein